MVRHHTSTNQAKNNFDTFFPGTRETSAAAAAAAHQCRQHPISDSDRHNNIRPPSHTPTSDQASGATAATSGRSSSSSSYTRMDWVPLPPPINPLAAVRRTTASVLQNANHVSLNGEAVEQLAKMWAVDGGAGGASVGWNETGWHYSEDAASGGSMTCQYVFVLGESIYM